MAEEVSAGRRRVMTVVAGVGSLAIGAVLAIPGASYVLDPLLRRRERTGDFLPVADESRLDDERPVQLPVIGEKVDAWTRAPQVQLGSVWVQKQDDGELLVHTAECPHLGCKIAYDGDADHFTCPCHESSFGLDGSVKDGPSPRPLDQLEARVVDGVVEVRFKRYRTQVEDQVEVG